MKFNFKSVGIILILLHDSFRMAFRSKINAKKYACQFDNVTSLAGAAVFVALTQSVGAAQQNTTMPVSVTVIANAKLLVIDQPERINISAADIAHGYLDTPATSKYSVTTNSHSGYRMEFHPVGNLFQSAQIKGLNSAVELGADGGTIVQRGLPPNSRTLELSYRFILTNEIKPGTYQWPLQLSVHAL